MIKGGKCLRDCCGFIYSVLMLKELSLGGKDVKLSKDDTSNHKLDEVVVFSKSSSCKTLALNQV